MKRVIFMILWALLWAVVLFLAVVVLLVAVVFANHRHHNHELDILGGYFITGLYFFLLCFARLPGARTKPGQPLRLGVIEGIWVIIAFVLMQSAGAVTIVTVITLEALAVTARHLPYIVDIHSHALLFLEVMEGELAACLWVIWYLRRLGHPRLTDGSATGIAWRPASAQAYYTAAGLTAGILLMVAGITYLLPPNMHALKGTTFDELAHGPLWTMPFLLLVIVFLGPVLEEMLFRGIMFAGIASQWRAGWAVALTAIVFVAIHAPEKIHYPPGFIDVGLAALANAWLRLRFNSIKPGMLLHILYNGGSMVVLGLMK
jgi:membrane protease YdiL (CAAX protease family)